MHHKENRDDDYLPCQKYVREDPDETGITRFEYEGKYYFSFIENDEIILRSEGYETIAGREKGIASVLKNITNDALHHSQRLPDGRWVLCLKASNHQEIARSCPYNTEEEVRVLMPGSRAKKDEMLALASIEAGQKTQEGVTFGGVEDAYEKVEDDYMICREYEENIDYKHGDYDDFIIFKHENTGKYYFALVNSKNEIVLRSEGYPNASARDSGLDAVRKSREIEKRLFIEEKRGLYYLVLRAGNHQEIARSCPKHSEEALLAIWKETGLSLPSVPAGLPEDAPNKTRSEKVDKEDDYLPCEAYKNHGINDETNRVAFFKKNNLYYFVIYNTDSSVRIRSEGFINTDNRDQELMGVLKHIDNTEQYETIEMGGYKISVLKDETGKEVGRSCSDKMAVPLASAMASVGTVGTENPKQGITWMWLLLPLLLLLGFLLFTKTCQPSGDQSGMIPNQTENPVGLDEAEKNANDSIIAAQTIITSDCGLNSILFENNTYEIESGGRAELEKMAKVLMDNSSWTALIFAHLEDKGNNELSIKRAEEAKRILVNLGINAGRVKTRAGSESQPITDASDIDTGKRFSNRVELFIYDAFGKAVCKTTNELQPQ